MFTHYLKIAFRNIRKNRLQTAISVIGLAIGLVCFSVSFLWLRYINSFEDFVADADRVYILGNIEKIQSATASYTTPDIISDVLKENLPEAEVVCKVSSTEPDNFTAYVSIDKVEDEDSEPNPNFNIIQIDDNFVEMFGVKVLQGNIDNLTENEIALTRSTAAKLFEDENVVGKTVYVLNDSPSFDREMTVKALIEDNPANTQFV